MKVMELGETVREFDISDEMIYDIVQNNIDDFERFIGNIAKNVI
ncbi:hypothetical protein [Clostridium sp. ZS1]|nr:hypothetical protein [Clostridium sp. ZS1]